MRHMKVSDNENLKKLFRTTANCLTIYRAIIALPLIFLLSNGQLEIAWFFIFSAAVSDVLDGFLARRAGGGSVFGAKLDPLADKILIICPLIWLNQNQLLPAWAIWLLISREILVTGWRLEAHKGGPASLQGKIKTILQFTSILFLIWPHSFGGILLANKIQIIGWYLFWPSLIIAMSSLFSYIKPQLSSNPK